MSPHRTEFLFDMQSTTKAILLQNEIQYISSLKLWKVETFIVAFELCISL